MWTPRRVLLLLSGFGVFIATYVGYAFWLGGIDGLPPLPHELEPAPNGGEVTTDETIVRPTSEADRKLELAFGSNWRDELKCNMKLEVREKNLVVALNEYKILEDGRIWLTPFNVAVFGKGEVGKYPEINTVRSDMAYLTFEQPVRTITDVGKNKIVAAELHMQPGDDGKRGPIRIRNNRRTPTTTDDVSLLTPGPLYYYDNRHLVETQAPVRLLDEQTKPEPSTIEAIGMRLHLATDQPEKPGQPPARRGKSQSVSGLESIELLAAVDMHLWVQSSGFLGDSGDKSKKNEPAKADEVPLLHITTQGPFRYYVSGDDTKAPDRAVFELPQDTARLPERVVVTRIGGAKGQEKRDQLLCDRLNLTFSRKADAVSERDGRSVSLTIQDAHAISTTGQPVELHSDTDVLAAYGNDFFYDARTKQSTLKGTPHMYALKDGHEIYARELQIDTGQANVRQGKARGPGRINMLDRGTGKRNQRASWSEGLDFNKEGGFDCLTLQGDAVFEDTESGQQLRGDTLKVWLLPDGGEAPAANEQQRLRPHHLKAIGHVRATSADLLIRWCEELMIWFKDVPALPKPEPASVVEKPVVAAPDRLAEAPLAATRSPAAPASAEAPLAASRSPAVLASAQPQAAPAPDKTPVAEKPAPPRTQGLLASPAPGQNKKPIELRARAVETYVLRCGDKNDLERVWCEGTVHVHQEPANAEDKGVDISGDTLHVTHYVEGNVMDVTGNLAQVQLDKLTIFGPAVTIDQKANLAKAHGIGGMQMLTKSSLQGEALAEPTELTIHWNRSMFFDGKLARFHGGVQAEQNNSTLLCQDMQAVLDRAVSFKEGDKRGQSASVQTLVCDKDVIINDTQYEGKQFVRKTRLRAPEVHVDKEESIVNASGPGKVDILQFGNADEPIPNPTVAPPAATPAGKVSQPAPKEDKELTLTRVHFRDKLWADNKQRIAHFWGEVEVFHVPTENLDLKIDENRPPPGCVHIRSENLKVWTRTLPDGKSIQEMEARKKVLIDSQEFWGQADVVKYDQSKEVMILEGGESGMAKLFRVRVAAGEANEMTAKKIWYYRKTNECRIDNGTRWRLD